MRSVIGFVYLFIIIFTFACAVQQPPPPEPNTKTTPAQPSPEKTQEESAGDAQKVTPEMVAEYARMHQISDMKVAEFRLTHPKYAKEHPYNPTPEDIEFYERKFLEKMYPGFKAMAEKVGFMKARRIYMDNPPAGPGSRNLGTHKYGPTIEKLARSGGEGPQQLIFEDDPAGFHYQEAMRLLKMERLDDAIKEMEKALEIKPDAPGILYNLGVMYMKKNDYPRATQLMEAALKHIKATGLTKINLAMYADAYMGSCVNLGFIYTRMGAYDEAVKILKEALKFRPNDIDANCNLANTYDAMGDSEKATEQIRKCISLDPKNASMHNFAGLMYYRKKLYNAALDEFKTAVKLAPGEKQYSYNLGLVLAALGRDDEANQAFKSAEGLKEGAEMRRTFAEQVRKNKIKELYNSGHTAMESLDYSRAIKLFEEVLKLEPDMMEAHFNLGVCYGAKHNSEKQIYHFKEAIRLKPQMSEAHYNLGLAYLGADMYQEAIDEFKQAIKLKPAFSDAHFQLGKTLYKMGKYAEAASEFKKCLKSGNSFEAYLNLGSCYMKTDDVPSAIEQFKKAIELKPNSAEAHYDLGAAYMNQEKYKEAMDLFQQTLKLDPSYRDARIMLKVLETNMQK